MKYTLYKPNSKNTGCACSFDIGSSGKNNGVSLYISFVLQSGWNDSNKTGSFKENAKNPDKTATVKLSAHEAGEFLSSLKTRIPYVAFHKSSEDTTIIKFTPWDKERKIKGKDSEESYSSPAFGLSISRNSSQSFKVALEAGETMVLAELLKDFIKQSLYAEAQNKEVSKNDSPAPAKSKGKPAPEPDDDDSDVPF